MFGEMPAHIRKRHASADKAVSAQPDVPSLGALDGIVLPPLALHSIPMEEVRAAVLDSSAKLDELTDKALRFYDELLSEPMSAGDMKLLGAQADAARTILTTQLRVDDSRLKKRNTDTMAALLARLEMEDARLVKVVA